MIKSCKQYITESGSLTIWTQDNSTIEVKLAECIRLSEAYRDTYQKVRDRKLGTSRKSFQFSEMYIFGRFDSFCARLSNLSVMLRKVVQFRRLFGSRIEGLLAEDVFEEEHKTFENAVRVLSVKDYDYLDFRNTVFDKDFSDFLVRLDLLTERITTKLEVAYDDIWDTPHAFQFLGRFEKLSRMLPVEKMSKKYLRMMATFRKEVDATARHFRRQSRSPALARNFPEVPGRMLWTRSLVAKLRHFVDQFEKEKGIRRLPEYREVVRLYNDTGVNFMKLELQAQEGWCSPTIRELETLIGKPVLCTDDAGLVRVNFDGALLKFFRENEKLCKLDIPLPSTNLFLLTKRNYFYEFKDMLELMTGKFYEVMGTVKPELKQLLTPHMDNVRQSLEPGMTRINWTYRDWPKFVNICIRQIDTFANLVERVNDIFDSRVEKTLESILIIQLFTCPKAEPWTLEMFVMKNTDKCILGAELLQKKSTLVENSIEDMIKLCLNYEPEEEDGIMSLPHIYPEAPNPEVPVIKAEIDSNYAEDHAASGTNNVFQVVVHCSSTAYYTYALSQPIPSYRAIFGPAINWFKMWL